MYCGSTTLVNYDGDEASAKMLVCRSWLCERCRPRRVAQMVAEGCGGSPNRFITLTLRRDDAADKVEQAKRLSRAWRLICKRITRDGGGKVEYLARLELTPQNRTPHLHVLVRSKWISQKWLSEVCGELLDAPVVSIESITSASKVAAYVSKYLGKDPEKIGTCKRYWKSKGYDQRPQQEKRASEWRYSRDAIRLDPIDRIARDFVARGYVVSWQSAERLKAVPLASRLDDLEPAEQRALWAVLANRGLVEQGVPTRSDRAPP